MFAGAGQLAALERAGAEREDPLPLERRADLAHQVQVAVGEEAAEDVEAADRPVALDHVDLERAAAVAGDPVAHVGQRALQPERLAHHVDRVGVLADVAEVGVAVVADQPSLADRAEQRAVGRERVDAGLLAGRRAPPRSSRAAASTCSALRVSKVCASRSDLSMPRGSPRSLTTAIRSSPRRRGCTSSSYTTLPLTCSTTLQLRRTVQEAAQRRGPRHDVRAAAGGSPSRCSQNDQIRRPSKSTSRTTSSLDVRPHPLVVDAHAGDVGGCGHVGIVREAPSVTFGTTSGAHGCRS